MPDKSQLPYLVKLLDDDSPAIRQHVLEQILAYGPDVEDALRVYEPALTHRQRTLLRTALAEHRDSRTRREAWRAWPSLEDSYARLERALDLLAQFQYHWAPPVSLGEVLDDLASSFLTSGRPMDPVGLSRFLFITKKFRGDADDYYNPLNSNLYYVIQERRGIPITLTAVFMLVGRRAGLEIRGCNVPGHFLAKATVNGEDALFDCFNRGRMLSRSDKLQLRATLSPHMAHVLNEGASTESIVSRVLRNMIQAYDQQDAPEKSMMARELLRDLQETARQP